MKSAIISFLLLLCISGSCYGQKIDTPLVRQMAKYMVDHVRYPALARENEIEGRVLISFKLNIDKSISNIGIIKAIGNGCDSEVVRVVRAYSGKLNLASDTYTISIDFEMSDGDDVKSGVDVSQLKNALKNFLFGVRIIGYKSIKKKIYNIDISRVTPYFDDRTGPVKTMTIYQTSGKILTSKIVERFDTKKRLTESSSYNDKNELIWKTTYLYGALGYKMITKNATGKVYSKELYSYKPQRIILRIYYNSDNGSVNSKTVYYYNDEGVLLTSTEYSADDRIRYMTITKLDAKGRKTEEDSYDSGIDLTGKRTFQYNEKNELEKDANYDKDGSLIYENTYVYNDRHQKVKSYFHIPANGVTISNTFKYDTQGRKIEDIRDISNNDPKGKKETIEYAEVDKLHNWHQAVWIASDDTYVIKREITYYPEKKH